MKRWDQINSIEVSTWFLFSLFSGSSSLSDVSAKSWRQSCLFFSVSSSLMLILLNCCLIVSSIWKNLQLLMMKQMIDLSPPRCTQQCSMIVLIDVSEILVPISASMTCVLSPLVSLELFFLQSFSLMAFRGFSSDICVQRQLMNLSKAVCLSVVLLGVLLIGVLVAVRFVICLRLLALQMWI